METLASAASAAPQPAQTAHVLTRGFSLALDVNACLLSHQRLHALGTCRRRRLWRGCEIPLLWFPADDKYYNVPPINSNIGDNQASRQHRQAAVISEYQLMRTLATTK